MAYSQVQIATSSPFGCVLKYHNRQDQYSRESDVRAAAAPQAAFPKNLKEWIRDHFHNCISVSSDSSSNENLCNHANNNINHHHHHHRQHLRCLTNQQDSNVNNVDYSSTMSRKQGRNLDRWAAKQAQEMVSTIDRQNQEALFLISAKESSHNSEHSMSQPENLSGSSKLGASSLVQIWEARLNRPEPKMDRSDSMKNNLNIVASSSRTSSGSSYNDILSSSLEEPLREPDIVDTVDWDTTAQSSRSSVHFSADVGENERVRIADIIKRLTSETNNHEQGNGFGDPPSRRHSCGSDNQAELRSLSLVVNSPKIRGRQAFNDLLWQMEQERQRELDFLAKRQLVSRFPQRGRIQSMIRLRCLRRGVSIQDKQRSQLIRTTIVSDVNRSQKGSTIVHLTYNPTATFSKQERFSAGGDQATSGLSDAAAALKGAKETQNIIAKSGEASTLNCLIGIILPQENSTPKDQDALPPEEDNSLPQICEFPEDFNEETSESSYVTWQGTSSEGEFEPGEVLEVIQSFNNWDGNEMDNEETFGQQDYGETTYDWFTDIARPRSYWEDQRQAWYQEMLNNVSDNNEIRQLLERRAVSNFLSSDFRERMDQLMVCHVQRQVYREDEENQERMGQLLLSYFRRHSHTAGSQQEDEYQNVDEGGTEGRDEAVEEEFVEGQVLQAEVEVDEEEEDEESSPSMPSSSPFSSWNYSHHQVVADNSQLVTSIPPPPPLPYQVSYQNSRHLSSTSHQSIDMELIYNLRVHMEQLQREMSALRKSMQNCMEMQEKVMTSIKQEVHPVPEAAISFDVTTKRHNCCICSEAQADSFLYGGRHMCTCLKCAHKLQRSRGKCPICRAPMLDVVRAYMDS